MAIAVKKKKCQNPTCAQREFFPKRTDQQFCDQQCKNHYHNNRKKRDKETTYLREGVLRKNQRLLQKLYNSSHYKDGVPLFILIHEEIDIQVFTDQQVVEKTQRRILWSHNYGLELVALGPDYIYKIHHR